MSGMWEDARNGISQVQAKATMKASVCDMTGPTPRTKTKSMMILQEVSMTDGSNV